MESIINKVSQLKKAVFGLTIKTATEPAMRKTNNPFVGRVKKVTTYTDAVLGVDYQNAVNNRLARKGFESNYQSEAPKGKKHYNNFFYQSLDNETFYLKIGLYSNTIIESQFFIDGQLATAEQLAELKTFLQSKSHFCQKQADYGLNNEQEQYSIVTPKASNILSIYQGNKPIYIQD